MLYAEHRQVDIHNRNFNSFFGLLSCFHSSLYRLREKTDFFRHNRRRLILFCVVHNLQIFVLSRARRCGKWNCLFVVYGWFRSENLIFQSWTERVLAYKLNWIYLIISEFIIVLVYVLQKKKNDLLCMHNKTILYDVNIVDGKNSKFVIFFRHHLS